MNEAALALWGGRAALSGPASATHTRWPLLGKGAAAALQRVLERGVLSGPNAPEARAFEAEFARFVGAEHALLTHSGTSALSLGLLAAGVGEGDHVIVPAYSFVASALSVLQAGAIPLFADVDPNTGLLDPRSAAQLLGPRTRAIMPVHVHGAACDLGPLLALAGDHGLRLVEDAAQAHGALWRGRLVGAIGDAGAFSLQSSKNLGVGEGGVLVTNDPQLIERAERLRNFGQNLRYADRADYDPEHPLDSPLRLLSVAIGGMYRGNELTAALGRAALSELPELTARCQRNAARLSAALAELPGVLPPAVTEPSSSVHHKFRVRFDPEQAGLDVPPRCFRDALVRALRAEGLQCVLWQSALLPEHPVFQERRGFGQGFPWSSDRDTDFDALYDPARFPNASALLDGSVVLFSQSYPLIAQTDALVERYADAFAKVWQARAALAERARASCT